MYAIFFSLLFLLHSYPKVLSFGPCQTPTLGFVVRRHLEMAHFTPEPFWRLEVDLSLDYTGQHQHRHLDPSSSSTAASSSASSSTPNNNGSGSGGQENRKGSSSSSSSGTDGEAATTTTTSLVRLEWVRGRVFDEEVGKLFLRRVEEEACFLVVAKVEQKATTRVRPQPLNTVGVDCF